VDVPGYGFAKVSKADRAKFATMIEEYLTTRGQLRGVVQLVDARHAPSADDVSMYQYLKYYHVKTLVIATKIDKTSRAKRASVIKTIKQTLDLNQTDELILFSAETGEGKAQVWKWLEQTAGFVGEA
jgi:GTP-binding protein